MSRSEPAMTRPTAVPYRRARKPKPMAMVRANSITDAIRRAGMKIDAEPGVWPVVKEGFRIKQAAGLSPGPGMSELVPPLGRRDLAVAIGGLVPGQADVARGGYQGD